jgi:hypothetical protein
MKNLLKIWRLFRCYVAEWALFKVVRLFPSTSREQYACALSHKAYIESIQPEIDDRTRVAPISGVGVRAQPIRRSAIRSHGADLGWRGRRSLG